MAQKKNSSQLRDCYVLSDLTQPKALDVEEAVLGGMLLDPSIVKESMEKLLPVFFFDDKHRMVFDAVSELVRRHEPVDIISVTNMLRDFGHLEDVGGPVAITDLAQHGGYSLLLPYYVEILKRKAIQRNLILVSKEIFMESFDDYDLDGDRIVKLFESAEDRIHDAIHIYDDKTQITRIDAIVDMENASLLERRHASGPTGIPSGLPSIDKVTLGWQKSTFTVIGGDTSVGKTAFALNVARNAAVDLKLPVAYFSLGVTSKRIADRLLITESGLSGQKIRGAVKLTSDELKKLDESIKCLRKAPLYIDDTPDLTTSQFASRARRFKKDKGVQLIIVDCIQQMQGPVSLRDNRIQETAAIVRTLKTTATRLDIPIIAISQLSRDIPKNAGLGKPRLYDLRDSGTIENNADMVIFIHRPEFSGLSEDPSDREIAWFIIAKNSDGETCDIQMKFKAAQGRFIEPDRSLFETFDPSEIEPIDL